MLVSHYMLTSEQVFKYKHNCSVSKHKLWLTKIKGCVCNEAALCAGVYGKPVCPVVALSYECVEE